MIDNRPHRGDIGGMSILGLTVDLWHGPELPPFPALGLSFKTGVYRFNHVIQTESEAVTFTRASAGSVNDSGGDIATVASGNARFDHTTDGATALGLLIEDSRQNIMQRSAAFDHATWLKTRAVIAADATASPDGGTNADRMTDDGSTGTGTVHARQAATITASVDWCFSIFAKADQLDWLRLSSISFDAGGDGDSFFDLGGGAVGTKDANHSSIGIEAFGAGWYRCHFIFQSVSDLSGHCYAFVAEADTDSVVDLDGTSSIFIWGAQLELGSFPSAYIPTTSASVTRAAETAIVDLDDIVHNPVIGALFAEITPTWTPDVEQVVLSIDDTSGNERMQVIIDSSANIRFRVTDGGVDQCDIDSGVNAARGVTFKVACRYRANDLAISVDGNTAVVDSSGTVPTVTEIDIGGNSRTGVLDLYSVTKTDAELEALTA